MPRQLAAPQTALQPYDLSEDRPDVLEGAPVTRRYREAVLDIETTNLRANMGMCIAAVVKPLGLSAIELRLDRYKDREPWDDSPLIADLRVVLGQCAKVITWNGSRFDFPFIRTRSFLNGLHYEPVMVAHCDLLYVARRTLLFTSHKLKTDINAFAAGQKPEPREETWRRAGYGDTAALDEITARCVEDCRQLEPVFMQLEPYIRSYRQEVI